MTSWRVNDVVGLPSQTGAADMEILFGGTLSSVERRWMALRYEIELPSALTRGESHSYALLFRFPDGQPPSSHYVVFPNVQMRDFTLRVRFDPSRLPARVWRIEDASHRELGDPNVAGAVMLPDRAGEITAEFHELSPTMAYGVALSWDAATGDGAGSEAAERAAPPQPLA